MIMRSETLFLVQQSFGFNTKHQDEPKNSIRFSVKNNKSDSIQVELMVMYYKTCDIFGNNKNRMCNTGYS